jgi:hypothetical protein
MSRRGQDRRNAARRAALVAAVLIVVAGPGAAVAIGQQRPPRRVEVEAEMGLRSEGDVVRGQLDTVGYAAVGYSVAAGSP